ncbi:hypothetical protein F9U64_19550 [Gracilibacillus oryzae]|uniref:Spore coat protein D n=1 Tax=Gracilibacillus oryzae TaxID=1672701 RepID=A0A7C8KWV2_9BACI|nr:CotD family spore coat protein [Gracilibacillus oryzae]KAB8126646.1 hypothetical protein F9U64_19550 [Gracilibacillus oryzae]
MGRYNDSRECDNNSVSPAEDEMIVSPTRRVTNTRTNYRTVKHIHPTEVLNVNRTVVRNENYYPVRNSNVNETVVEDYNCGSDINSPNCQRVSPASTNNGRKCKCRRRRSWI